MTDIIIKSFNRPHYLDRCLFSIYKNITGDFHIKIVDDGTPEKYLNKIKNKYPEVEIILTQNWTQKIEAISRNLNVGEKIDGFSIPIDDWKKVAAASTDYFIMTEDDIWFTKEININNLVKSMSQHQTSLIKIGWISNRPIKATITKENENIQFLQPKLFTAPKLIMDAFFDNKYMLFSSLYRLKIVDNNTKVNYWILNALLCGLYEKKYWLHVWHSLKNKVDELEQIKNATQWYRKRKSNQYLYAKLKELAMNTTFQSSATTSYHEHYNINFDVNQFNYYLNEAWFEDKLNVTEDLPHDISVEKITAILNEKNNPNATSENWKKWTEIFKAQYRKQQVDVDN